MTRRPPPRKGRAQVQQSVTVSKGSRGRVTHQENHVDIVEVPVEPGESEVGVGFDVKYWASDQSQGMTVGASTHVKLSCKQDLDSLSCANDLAADLAYNYVSNNALRVQKDLYRYLDDDSK